ncbi:uncharacterized protein LOC124263429 isoform X2 [Haliotis rubra]|uniref:uncharacterized protein LOC124263429 isoform X2 n=1 Tax=Haliotis rubra TaxID=36100 RepID=UPI001EE4EC37|nr:uncharacterized protein LOC124263429 isoform X2 [Haliotis rubra]
MDDPDLLRVRNNENLTQRTQVLSLGDRSNIQSSDSHAVVSRNGAHYREHSEMVTEGTDIHINSHSQHKQPGDGDFREHVQTLFIHDESNMRDEGNTQNDRSRNRDDGDLRQRTQTLNLIDRSSIRIDDRGSHVSNINDDDLRQHTDILYISDGSSIQIDETDSQHVSNIPDDDLRQHTDILYINDGSSVHIDDRDLQQLVQGGQLEDYRQPTETLYITDGSNVHQDDPETSGVDLQVTRSQDADVNVDGAGVDLQVTRSQDADVNVDGAGVDLQVTRSQDADVNVDGAGVDLQVTRSQDADVSVDGAGVDLQVTRSQDADVSVDGAGVDLQVTRSQDADVSVDGAGVDLQVTRRQDADVNVDGAGVRHHSLHLHGDSDLLQQDTEDERHHTDILYLSDAGNVHIEDNLESVASESETHNNLRQHSETRYANFGSSEHFEDTGDTKSESVAEMEADTLRQHTETIYFTDSNRVLQEDTGDTKSEIVTEAEDDTFRQHTETVHVTDSVRDYDEGNQVIAETCDRTDFENDEDIRHHTETIYISDTGNERFDEGVDRIGDKDEGSGDHIRHHTETLYLTDEDNIEDDEDESVDESSESDDEVLTQHRQIVYITDEGDKRVDNDESDVLDGVRSDTQTLYVNQDALGGDEVLVDEDNVRSDTQTLYIHQSTSGQEDNKQLNSDVTELERSEEFEIIEMSDTVYVHQSAVGGDEVLVDEGDERSDTQTLNVHQSAVGSDEVLVDEGDVRSDTQTLNVHQSAVGSDEVLVDEGDERSDTQTLNVHQSAVGSDEVLVDEGDERSDTQTMYIHQSTSSLKDNEQINSDITELEISAIERSEEFEIIEVPETLLSSSFIDSSERHRHMLEDSLDYTDPLNDSTGVYSRNISVEYDRADQKALDEFIDEREITTSAQVHLALEETDDQENHYRSDNDVKGQSSDEDYDDDISSHRLLVQSDRDSSLESEENVSTSENMDVEKTETTGNGFNIRGNLASGLSPGTLPADYSESSSRYTVISQVTMETLDRCEGVTEVAETQVMVKADSDIHSHNVTEFTTQSTSEVYGDENKAPHLLNTVLNETQARPKKPEPTCETDEHSRSGDSNENRRLTGKKAGDWPQVEDPLLSEEDISVKQDGQNPGTADRYRVNSPSAAVTDVKLGNEGSYGAESANSLWKRDNVEEQYVTVEVRQDVKDGLLREGVGCSRVITARTDAKVELAESEQTADVKGTVIKTFSEERAVTKNSDTITDADSPRNGNTQQLLETENVDFSSGLREADSGLSVSGLSGSRQDGGGVYAEELNRDGRGIGSGVEVEKNTGEWTYGVVSVVNTVSSDATSISNESDITENVNVTSRQISEHSERLLNVTDSSVTFGHSDSRNLGKSEQFVVFNSENSAINTVIQTASIETESVTHSDLKRADSNSEFATSVKDSYERVNERINLYTERDNLSKYATQTEELPISSDELKQVNAGDCQTVNTCVTGLDEALNATGVGLKEPTVLHSDNANTLHIDEFDNGVLSCSVQAGNLGYLANMADSPKVSSAEGEQTRIMEDNDSGLCFTDRSETILPVEQRSVIRTKVQYKVKKTTKTVMKTNVDVKKVQKHSTGDSVEHEHLTKVEQTTVVRQKIFSSTESLDIDEHDQENMKIEYKAVIDATKDKDGRQLPSAHYETSFETVLPRVVGQNVLHGESEDVLAVCGPETDNVPQDQSTVIAGHVSIEPSPGVVQSVGENTDRATLKPSDVAPHTDTGSIEEMTASDFVVESDSVTSVMSVVSPETVEIDNSLESTGSQTVTSRVTEVTDSVSADKSSSSSSSVMKSDIAEDGSSDNSVSSEYTERTEIFIQPHALSPITVRRKRWSTERNFADNKLICTVFEDTDSPSPPKDEALYILEDNIHVATNSTDRREDFVVMPSKHSYKNRPYLETKPMWTYDLASLSGVRYVEEGENVDENDSDSTLVDSDGGEMEATDGVVSPDSASNTVQITGVDDENMEGEEISTDNSQTVKSEYLQTDSFTNVTTQISKQVTATNISHTYESYSDSSKDEEYITDSMSGSATEATVRSLHGTMDSTLSLTGNGGVRSGAELSDTLDPVTVSALPEDEYTAWEETELSDEDVNTNSLFLGGGSSERIVHNVKIIENTETKQTTGPVISESDCTNFSPIIITVKSDIDEGEAERSCRDVVIDDNGNVLQGKQPDTVSLRPEREVCDLSSSSVSVKKKETEDRRSVVGGLDGEEKNDLFQDVGEIDIRVESEGNAHTERTQTDLSRGVETNIDDLQSESNLLVTDASHSVLTLHQTQAAQINSQTEGLHSRGDNEGGSLVQNETWSGFSDSDDNLRHTDRTEDKQLGNEPDLMLEGVE